MRKIIHYRDKCIGCAICYELQPALWRMSRKDGKAHLLNAITKKGIHQLSVSPRWSSQNLWQSRVRPTQ